MARNALFIMVLFLTGCMSTYVKLDVTATDNINLNQFNEPLPVVLKVYQLTDIQAFKNSTFEQLWKSDKSILANTLVTVEERTVNPSDRIKIEFEQAESAKYVAFVALFRDRTGGNWRAFYDLNDWPVPLSTSLDIEITSNSLRLPEVEEDK
ncbi:type VI secretion system lipoprotein TssJ [Pseudoalteromonas piscicida]|uniref:Type VI secretion system lipoprotein TssJ n=5 Tax=Pseudoalteromonas TaxID=53246 RepID=A0AAD0W3Q6_PSEO7|nr:MULTISPECIES: type VI secretion system lipoprotein TssJ [Pseudoalteromonas]AUJ70096.1 Type VI secretion lipoprotein [Pseudoalteromonas sp. NC201]MBR8845152.1 type VI secretion system lipoprotein TssJ [Pseudoalteromonas sp. JC3]NKC18579.1 type VI secretion system lipoprotein TssJ [Pseudoalteromonas galatheae]NSY32621.1 type VI secretion system lipoprotein TssJ [Pseudoalteromonas sp. JC28]QQQ68856.1 type VI secretion system lipoprotein TssJ [Pseudoalteromonas sp. GCY]QUI63500.1 type VI secre